MAAGSSRIESISWGNAWVNTLVARQANNQRRVVLVAAPLLQYYKPMPPGQITKLHIAANYSMGQSMAAVMVMMRSQQPDV
jgi:hypothetical protein